MRKVVLLLFILMLLVPVRAEDDPLLVKNAKSAILIEPTTGKIIYEKNVDEKLSVASLTKMTAQILIMEALAKKELKMDEEITASINASGMGGSQIYLQTGEVMTVKDLLKGISIASANDATVALAERLAGTEAEFVKLMNKKVKELGLKNTNFVNATGLDEDGNYSTAADLAIIAQELINKYPEILNISSIYEDYLRVNTANKFWLVNTNKLVRFYQGADGLKTGHTDDAKYCIAATAKRNNMRLIAIILGEDNIQIRNQEASALLDYGFNLYKMNMLKERNEVVGEIYLDQAKDSKITIVPAKDIGILSKKSEPEQSYQTELKMNKINLPINKGEIVGKIVIKDDNNKIIKEENVTVQKNVIRVNVFTLFGRLLKDIIISNNLKLG